MKLVSVAAAMTAVFVIVACGSDERSGFPDGDPTGGAPGQDDSFGKPRGEKPGDDDPSPCGQAKAAKGYAGCDFQVAPSPLRGTISDQAPCYAVFLTNVAPATTSIKVRLGNQALDAKQFARIVAGDDPSKWAPIGASGLEPGQMAVLFLSHSPGAQSVSFDPLTCPITPAVTDSVGQPLITAGRGTTFHIQTDNPVVAYDIMPFGGARSFAPSAQILLPTSAWGKNYVGVLPPHDKFRPEDAPTDGGWMMVSALEADTTVEVGTRATGFVGSGADSVPAYTKKKVTLGAGEYVLWFAPTATNVDASGTVFTSNKPVSLMAGDLFTGITSATSGKRQPMINGSAVGTPQYCCMDASHQMIAPVSGLGSEYVAAPFPTRLKSMQEESVRYRLVGLVDGTELKLDPAIPGAPKSLAFGATVDFDAQTAFRISSQDEKHPFYLAQLMSYGTVAGENRDDGTVGSVQGPPPFQLGIGDPEFVTLLPSGQYLSEYTFLTDPTYATTSLVVIRQKGDKGFSEVSLECLGGNITGWAPVGSAGTHEFARIDLTRKKVPNGKCGTNFHKAKSEGKFSVMVWGVDYWASYAYPAGGSIAKLNDVVVVPK